MRSTTYSDKKHPDNRINKSRKQKPEKDIRTKSEWEEYNQENDKKQDIFLTSVDHKVFEVPGSYTHLFFNVFSLMSYTNKECRTWVQFGASKGVFLNDLKEGGCEVIGYDYSNNAVEQLKKNDILARKVDLNAISIDKNGQSTLSCQEQLSFDLKDPLNLVAIRILDYLDDKAKALFIRLLIEKSQPGTVFFLSDSEHRKPNAKSMDENSGWIKSNFGPRTDMRQLFFTRSMDPENREKLLKNLVPTDDEAMNDNYDDHILVYEKLDQPSTFKISQ